MNPGPGRPRRHVSAIYIAMLAVGMVVGAGIFKSPALVADAAGAPAWLFAAWATAGLITLIGALCYAELATAFPHPGGDYHFIGRAFGRSWAFLFAWARFAVINTGSIALLGIVLGDYLNGAFSLGPHGAGLYAALSVGALTLFNLKGAGAGNDAADYGLTSLEVLGLLVLVAAAIPLILAGKPPAEPLFGSGPGPGLAGFGVALVYALLAFGGWSEVATLSAEVNDPKRGMMRALVLAVGLITALFLAVNWAFWYGLGVTGLAGAQTPAVDLIAKAFGPAAGLITALAIAFAVITSINATIVVGARTTYAWAQDWRALKLFSGWDDRKQIPVAATWAQGAIALALIVLASAYEGFATLVEYTAPIYWLFLTMSGLAVLALRRKEPHAPRPYRVPFFPVLPIVFVATSAAMLASSFSYVTEKGSAGLLASVGVFVTGIVALLIARRSQDSAA